jgi:glycosyltransferase involved in cell wall biosynthesis
MISLYIIALNEESIIGRCIDSFKEAVDETIVVVDDRTTDQTEQIATEHGAKTSLFKWIDDFGAMKNHALAQCTGDWCMCADADDILDPDSPQLVREAVRYADEQGLNSITTQYWIASDENGNPTIDNMKTRLTRKGTAHWHGAIHEYLICDRVHEIVTNIEIHHKRPAERTDGTARNIRILEKVIPTCSPSDLPRYSFYYARELMFAGKFCQAILWFDKYLLISNWDAEKHRAYCDKAECYYLMGEREDARRVLQEAIDFNPLYSDPYVKTGIIWYEQGDPELMREYFRLATDRLDNLHPLFPSKDMMIALMNRYSKAEA